MTLFLLSKKAIYIYYIFCYNIIIINDKRMVIVIIKIDHYSQIFKTIVELINDDINLLISEDIVKCLGKLDFDIYKKHHKIENYSIYIDKIKDDNITYYLTTDTAFDDKIMEMTILKISNNFYKLKYFKSYLKDYKYNINCKKIIKIIM